MGNYPRRVRLNGDNNTTSRHEYHLNWSYVARKVMLGCLILTLFVFVNQLSNLRYTGQHQCLNTTMSMSSETDLLFMSYALLTSVMSVYTFGPPYSTLVSIFISTIIVGVGSVHYPQLTVQFERMTLTIINLFIIAEYFLTGWMNDDDTTDA